MKATKDITQRLSNTDEYLTLSKEKKKRKDGKTRSLSSGRLTFTSRNSQMIYKEALRLCSFLSADNFDHFEYEFSPTDLFNSFFVISSSPQSERGNLRTEENGAAQQFPGE